VKRVGAAEDVPETQHLSLGSGFSATFVGVEFAMTDRDVMCHGHGTMGKQDGK
jgi:hypothetical protein